jgi:hypothetical protein
MRLDIKFITNAFYPIRGNNSYFKNDTSMQNPSCLLRMALLLRRNKNAETYSISSASTSVKINVATNII